MTDDADQDQQPESGPDSVKELQSVDAGDAPEVAEQAAERLEAALEAVARTAPEGDA
jgi:hypothetical protein